MTSKTITRTLTIPASIHITNRSGLAFKVDMTKVPEAVLSTGFESMLTTVLLNTYNGGGSEASEADKLAALTKRVNGLYAGQWAGKGGGGASLVPYMWDALMSERGIDPTNKKAADAFKAECGKAVVATFGKDAKATFANYLDHVAATLAKARKLDDEARTALRDRLGDKYTDLAIERRRAEAEAASEVDVSADLDAMLDGIEL